MVDPGPQRRRINELPSSGSRSESSRNEVRPQQPGAEPGEILAARQPAKPRDGTRSEIRKERYKKRTGGVPVLFGLVKGDEQPLKARKGIQDLLCIPLHGLHAA